MIRRVVGRILVSSDVDNWAFELAMARNAPNQDVRKQIGVHTTPANMLQLLLARRGFMGLRCDNSL